LIEQIISSRQPLLVNVFETPKEDTAEFEGVTLNWGAAFTQQMALAPLTKQFGPLGKPEKGVRRRRCWRRRRPAEGPLHHQRASPRRPGPRRTPVTQAARAAMVTVRAICSKRSR
jgi:hypothetical protein